MESGEIGQGRDNENTWYHFSCNLENCHRFFVRVFSLNASCYQFLQNIFHSFASEDFGDFFRRSFRGGLSRRHLCSTSAPTAVGSYGFSQMPQTRSNFATAPSI